MDSILFLIAQFLMPRVSGLDVVPHQGDIHDYAFDHPVGVFLLKLGEGMLHVELAFRMAPARCAADYLEAVRKALEAPVPLGAPEEGALHYKFDRCHYLGQRGAVDFHAITFHLVKPPAAAGVSVDEA